MSREWLPQVRTVYQWSTLTVEGIWHNPYRWLLLHFLRFVGTRHHMEGKDINSIAFCNYTISSIAKKINALSFSLPMLCETIRISNLPVHWPAFASHILRCSTIDWRSKRMFGIGVAGICGVISLQERFHLSDNIRPIHCVTTPCSCDLR